MSAEVLRECACEEIVFRIYARACDDEWMFQREKQL
jgi:hypothetical protein